MAYQVFISYVPLNARKTVDGNSYDVEWFIVSDTAMSQKEALSVEELPLLKSRNPEDRSVALTSIQAEPREGADPFKWTLILTYADTQGNLFFPSKKNDPTKWPAEIGFDSYTYQAVVRKAYRKNGKDKRKPSIDVQNSADKEFDPAYQQPESGTIINISRNERHYDGRDKKIYRNSINKNKISIAGMVLQPFEGWIRTIRGVRKVDDEGEFYWTVSYEIVVKDWDDGWRVDIKDTSFYIKTVNGANVDYKFIQEYMIDSTKAQNTKEGQARVTEAQNLDGEGQLAPIIEDPISGLKVRESVYLPFYTYPIADWKNLSLPAQEADHAYAE